MSTDPFSDPDGTFLVLSDDTGRYSLWPATVPVPQGWRSLQRPADRRTCLELVEDRAAGRNGRGTADGAEPGEGARGRPA